MARTVNVSTVDYGLVIFTAESLLAMVVIAEMIVATAPQHVI